MSDIKKRLFDAFSERARVTFEQDRNPLHVWQTINNAVAAGAEVPTWCREYLRDVSMKLLAIRDASTVDQVVKKAIGIDGNHIKTFPHTHKKTGKQRCYNRVNELIRIEGETPGDAILLASEELRLAPSTVRNAYYQVKKKLSLLFASA